METGTAAAIFYPQGIFVPHSASNSPYPMSHHPYGLIGLQRRVVHRPSSSRCKLWRPSSLLCASASVAMTRRTNATPWCASTSLLRCVASVLWLLVSFAYHMYSLLWCSAELYNLHSPFFTSHLSIQMCGSCRWEALYEPLWIRSRTRLLSCGARRCCRRCYNARTPFRSPSNYTCAEWFRPPDVCDLDPPKRTRDATLIK